MTTITPGAHNGGRQGYRSPTSTTDAIIEYAQGGVTGIILIARRNPPHGLALPGGFHEYGLTLEENAIKEVQEETNLEFIIRNPGKPWTYSDPARDPRGHMIGHVFYGTGRGFLRAGDDAAAARLYSYTEVNRLLDEHERGAPVFAFDHARIISDYLGFRGVRG